MDYQIIGVYISLLGIIIGALVSTITYLKQKEKKKLTFEGIQSFSPENINGKLKNELAVKYPDRLVSDLYLLTANICNTGDLSIRDYDIITPIKISFPERIIGCDVIKEDPENIDVHLTINYDENLVECKFELLNVREYFTLEFVSLEKLSVPKIVFRIDNLSRMKVSNFDVNYSSVNMVKRGVKKVLGVLRDIDTMPIVTLIIPGIIILIGSLFLAVQFLQDFMLGKSLFFGPTILMIMLFIAGGFMILIGLLTRLIGANYKSLTNTENY